MFSGFDAATKSYDKATWNYEEGGNETPKAVVTPGSEAAAGQESHGKALRHRTQPAIIRRAAPTVLLQAQGHQAEDRRARRPWRGAAPPPPSLPPNVAYDLSLQDPRCVFQLLKQQYSRYTPEMVANITGIPQEQLLKAWDLYTSVRKDGDMKKVSTIIYAVGWTQHSNGTQVIRAACVLQLLMGNVGRAGGGVNALRGHSNIQGATDMAGIFDILPGYLKMPNPADKDLKTFLDRITPKPSKPGDWESFNYWSNTPKFMVSFLKAMYGPAATKDNDFAFNWLPKIDRNYSWVQNWNDMYEGHVKGVFAFGMNGVMIGPDSKKNIDALKKADFLVVCEIYPDETSAFWQAPGTTPEEMKQINTTVYQLPGAGFAEKDGTFVNSARWLQWKYAALPTPAECRLDQDILSQIFLRVRELYKKEGGKFPDPIVNATWTLHHADQSVAGRGGEGDQRQGAGRYQRREDESFAESRTAIAWLRRVARRRFYLVGQLAVLRLVDRSWSDDATPWHRRSFRSGDLSELGLVMAGESARAVQPRFVRSHRQTLRSLTPAGVVECGHG